MQSTAKKGPASLDEVSAERRAAFAHVYDERILTSLSEHITTVRLSDSLQKGDDPNLVSWVLMAHLAARLPDYACCADYGSDHATQCHSSRFAG